MSDNEEGMPGARSMGATTQALLRNARATGEDLAAIDHLLQLGYDRDRAERACRPYQPTLAMRYRQLAATVDDLARRAAALQDRLRRIAQATTGSDQEEREARLRGERFSRALHEFVDWQERTRAIASAKAQRDGVDYDDVVVTEEDYCSDDW